MPSSGRSIADIYRSCLRLSRRCRTAPADWSRRNLQLAGRIDRVRKPVAGIFRPVHDVPIVLTACVEIVADAGVLEQGEQLVEPQYWRRRAGLQQNADAARRPGGRAGKRRSSAGGATGETRRRHQRTQGRRRNHFDLHPRARQSRARDKIISPLASRPGCSALSSTTPNATLTGLQATWARACSAFS
jgi:hypothetical protein